MLSKEITEPDLYLPTSLMYIAALHFCTLQRYSFTLVIWTSFDTHSTSEGSWRRDLLKQWENPNTKMQHKELSLIIWIILRMIMTACTLIERKLFKLEYLNCLKIHFNKQIQFRLTFFILSWSSSGEGSFPARNRIALSSVRLMIDFSSSALWFRHWVSWQQNPNIKIIYRMTVF